jgi:hypothetical protein
MWKLLNDQFRMEYLGFIPEIIRAYDPKPVRAQIAERYAHGYDPIPHWTLSSESNNIQYPGDEPLVPRAQLQVRDELVLVYDYAFVAIVQQNGDFAVQRMD